MAVDYGDDVGEMLLRSIARAAGRSFEQHASSYIREQSDAVKQWYAQYLESQGVSSEEATRESEAIAAREQVCIPFGNKSDAAYFTQVCRDNGVTALALADKAGNGYLFFTKDDLSKVEGCVPQFSEVMTVLKNRELAERIEKTEPVTAEQLADLEQIENLPDLPTKSPSRDVTLFPVAVRFNDTNEIKNYTFSEQDTEGLDIDDDVFFSGYTHDKLEAMVGKDIGEDFTVLSVGQSYQVKAKDLVQETPGKDVPERSRHVHDDRANDPYNHTKGIRDKVMTARENCRDFDDFKSILAKEGVGITTAKDGELMYYEARFGEDGKLLPFGENEQGLHDWAVSAKTLANDKWKCEATNDWFSANTPKDPSIPQKAERIPTEPQVADGSKDMDGSTPDIDQGIESHDGMDTATSTFRMEYEQTASGDVAPSDIREQADAHSHDDGRGYSLSSKAKDVRAASRQLEKESGITEHEIDISDKLNPVR